MLLLLFICAEIKVIDEAFHEFQEKEEEINHAITGKKKIRLMKHLKFSPNPKCPSDYKSAKICIAQGGLPPSNDTTATDMQRIHDDAEQKVNHPLTVACRHSRDVFEQPAGLRREPEPK